MLSVDALRKLLTGLESDRLERTNSTRDTGKFAEAVPAFANDLPGHGLPGYLLVGVRKDGKPDSLQVTDQLLPCSFLKPADGAIGAHVFGAQDCFRDFASLAARIARACGLPLPG